MEGKVGEQEGEREKKNGQEGFGGFLVSPSPEFCTLATSSPELVAQSAAYCWLCPPSSAPNTLEISIWADK